MTSQNISKKIENIELRLAADIGPRGGRIIGYTKKDNKPIYEKDHDSHKTFSPNEHLEASNAHEHEIAKIKKSPHLYGSNVFDQIKHHKNMAQKHLDNSGMFKDPSTPSVNKAAKIANAILERTLLATDFEEYKKEHPSTKKTQNDPMFKPAYGQTGPHMSHKDMMKLPANEHHRLESEHLEHAFNAEDKGDHENAAKHRDAAAMHMNYSTAVSKPQKSPYSLPGSGQLKRDQEQKKLRTNYAEQYHKKLSS